MHSVYISYSRKAHFLHTCFDEGPLITFTHHHLCHCRADQSALSNRRKRASNEQLANKMALFNVDL